MGTLTCSRCGATTEADSIDEGRKKLDHAVGLDKGTPCDGTKQLYLTGIEKVEPKPQTSKSVGNTKKQHKKFNHKD